MNIKNNTNVQYTIYKMNIFVSESVGLISESCNLEPPPFEKAVLMPQTHPRCAETKSPSEGFAKPKAEQNLDSCPDVSPIIENESRKYKSTFTIVNNPNPLQKKNNSKFVQSNTIDEKHTEMLNHFNETETKTIPKLQIERAQLKHILTSFRETNIEKYMETKDNIQKITSQIRSLNREKKKYFLENSKYIFQYFEYKKKISSGDNNNKNVNKLNSFFNIKEITSTNSETNETVEKDIHKHMYQNYWKNVKNEITNIQDFIVPSDVCEYCRQGEMIPQDEEGILICNNNKCGKFVTYIVDSSKPTNKEPPNEVSYTAYIRLNHFKEILSQFQAKETTQIPDEVIEAIRNRIKKERIKDIKTINYEKMREILRKLGLNKYFEHIQYINSIFGIKPPIMNEELHETLCVLFIEIQKPWAIHCPANRTNFFNYTYTLYQLCVLLGQTQYLPYIPLLKDRTKQLEQDMIWKKVCNELSWYFEPTI